MTKIAAVIYFLALLSIAPFAKKFPNELGLTLLVLGTLTFYTSLEGLFKKKITLRYGYQPTSSLMVIYLSVAFLLISLILDYLYLQSLNLFP